MYYICIYLFCTLVQKSLTLLSLLGGFGKKWSPTYFILFYWRLGQRWSLSYSFVLCYITNAWVYRMCSVLAISFDTCILAIWFPSCMSDLCIFCSVHISPLKGSSLPLTFILDVKQECINLHGTVNGERDEEDRLKAIVVIPTIICTAFSFPNEIHNRSFDPKLVRHIMVLLSFPLLSKTTSQLRLQVNKSLDLFSP